MATQTAPQQAVYSQFVFGNVEYTVSPPTWSVASASNPKISYIVSVDPRDGLYTCTCPDFVYRRRDCKHAKQVQRGEAGKPRLRMSGQRRAVAPTLTVDDLYA